MSDSPAVIPEDALGAYDFTADRMIIDEVRLLDGAEELLDKGFSRGEAADILAWKMLPTVVHEITHAMTHHDMVELFGGPMVLPFVEEEVLAFFDMVLVLREMFEKRPVLWDRKMILDIERTNASVLRAWKKDTSVLERMVAASYPDLSPLAGTPRKDLLAAAELDSVAAEDRVRELRGLLEDEAAAGHRDRILRLLRQAESLRVRRRKTVEVLADEGSYKRLKSYYKARLDERKRRLDEPREDPG